MRQSNIEVQSSVKPDELQRFQELFQAVCRSLLQQRSHRMLKNLGFARRSSAARDAFKQDRPGR